MLKRWQLWLGLAVSAVFMYLALRNLHLAEVWSYIRTGNYLWLIPA